jgi:hypothetical protein
MATIEIQVFLPVLVPHAATLAFHDVHIEQGIYVE